MACNRRVKKALHKGSFKMFGANEDTLYLQKGTLEGYVRIGGDGSSSGMDGVGLGVKLLNGYLFMVF